MVEILTTGIAILDDALGGGLLEDSNLLILYDAYSYGWSLAFEIMRNRMGMGDFGVIVDSILPLSSLEMELGGINFDLKREGEAGNLAILDIFSSFYGIKYPEVFVYTDQSIDESTFLPKYLLMYRRALREIIGDRRPVGVDATLDGMAFLLGEDNFIRILQRLMAVKEEARLTEKRKRPLNIWLMNKGRVSEKLISWMAVYSHYVIEFHSSEDSFEERMFVRKSPLPGFKSREGGYRFRLDNGRIKLRPFSQ